MRGSFLPVIANSRISVIVIIPCQSRMFDSVDWANRQLAPTRLMMVSDGDVIPCLENMKEKISHSHGGGMFPAA